MSSEWVTHTVEEIAAPTQAAMATGPFGSSISAKYFVDSGVPVIRGSNLSPDTSTRLIEDGLVFITADKAREFERSTARRGDLIFTCWGTINQVGLIDRRATFDRYVVSNKQMKLTVDPMKADPRFIYYVFSSAEKQAEILDNGIGSSVPGFNLGQLKRHAIALPGLPEQSLIADFLESIDDRITLLRETNATLEAIAQALFKSWFVDFDPVRAKRDGRAPEGMDEATAALFPDGFEESELGAVPRGWTADALGKVAQIARNPMRPNDMRDDLHYVGLEHMPRKCLSLTDWGLAGGLESAKACFSAGDILFGKLRPYFHKVVIAPIDGVCSTDILVCQSRAQSYYAFVAMHLFSEPLVTYADRLSNGAKMPRVNWKDLADYRLVVPPSAVAGAFTKAVLPLLDRMTANVFLCQTLSALRDTLLPRLISGQLRLPEASAAIYEVPA